MAQVRGGFDFICGLKGKAQDIVTDAAIAQQWYEADLFKSATTTHNIPALCEKVLPLARSGDSSGTDWTTPIVAAACILSETVAGDDTEQVKIENVRKAVVALLKANAIPLEWGRDAEKILSPSAENEAPPSADYPALRKFDGQETTREAFLAQYVHIKASNTVLFLLYSKSTYENKKSHKKLFCL